MSHKQIVLSLLGLAVTGVAASFLIPFCFETQTTAQCVWCSQVATDVHKIRDAEDAYHASTMLGKGSYAYDLKTLAAHPESGNENLLRRLAETGTKEGYRFGTIPNFNAAGESDPSKGFAYYAVPETYGTTGRLTYIQNQTRFLYSKDTGSNTPPSSWPTPSPEAAGWTPHPE